MLSSCTHVVFLLKSIGSTVQNNSYFDTQTTIFLLLGI